MPTSARRLLPLVVALSAFGCGDEPAPLGPVATSPRLGLSAAASPGKGKSALDLIEEDYANGLVDKERVNLLREQAVSARRQLPSRYQTTGLTKDGTPSMVAMALQWKELSQQTRSTITELRKAGLADLVATRETPHFILHYTAVGEDAVPAQDLDRNGVSDFIDAAAASWEEVWDREINQLGYPAPKGSAQQKFQVYYKDLGPGFYGYTHGENVEVLATSPVVLGTASAYIVVDNDFYGGFLPNDEDVTGNEVIRTGSLKVTQAHEFMHALQFATNFYQSRWLMEAHATWSEDQVYPNVNDWHWFVGAFLDTPELPLLSRYWYGAAFFMHWLTDTRGIALMRQIEEDIKTRSAADALRALAFGGSWEGMKEFAQIEYLGDIRDFTKTPSAVIPNPTVAVRTTHSAYPVSVVVAASSRRSTNGAPSALGANLIEFAGASGDLTITFDGADGYAWRAVVIATPRGRSAPVVLAFPLDVASAGSLTIAGMGTRWSKVTLAPTIAGSIGSDVPFTYGANVGSATIAASGQ